MKVKRFTAANMQTALRLVSQELGPDAVILSSKKVTDGIEVVAALDYQPQAAGQEIERQLQLQRELEQVRAAKQQTVAPAAARQARINQARGADVSSKAGLAAALSELKQPAASAPGRNAGTPQPERRREQDQSGDLYNHALQQMQGELRELKDWMVSHQGSPWD